MKLRIPFWKIRFIPRARPKEWDECAKAWRELKALIINELKIPQLTDWLNNKLLKLLKWIKRGF